MKKTLYKIANPTMYIGIAIILLCVFILGDENGDGQIDNKPLMIIGGIFIFIGGLIRYYQNYNEPIE